MKSNGNHGDKKKIKGEKKSSYTTKYEPRIKQKQKWQRQGNANSSNRNQPPNKSSSNRKRDNDARDATVLLAIMKQR